MTINEAALEQFTEDLRGLFDIHDFVEIDADSKTVRVFHDCGCHDSLLDRRFHVEPVKKFQDLLDRYDAWFENENAETGKVYFN